VDASRASASKKLPRRPERLLVRARLPIEPGRTQNAIGDRVGLVFVRQHTVQVANLPDHLAQRPKRDPLAVGETVAVEHGRVLARGRHELPREP
jgi:hypothetical protein